MRKTVLLFACILSLIITSHASANDAISVSISLDLNAPAHKVWKVVGDFDGVPQFVEAIVSSVTQGNQKKPDAIRTLTLKDGGIIVEKLLSYDKRNMTYTYTILESPLPLDEYVATMQVTDNGKDQCTFTWSSTFKPRNVTPEEAKALVEDFYNMGFDGLKKIFEQ